MSRDKFYDQNRNARIVTRVDRTGKLRTETQRRDAGTTSMAVSTDQQNNSTNLFIDFTDVNDGEDVSINLNGREARSLYRLLRRHYGKAGKSIRVA